jgi:hypothetical protein
MYIYMYQPCYALRFRFKTFPMIHSLGHTMKPYRSLYEFAVLVRADDEVPYRIMSLDFEKIEKLLASLPHLKPANLEHGIIVDPWNDRKRWRLYDRKQEGLDGSLHLPGLPSRWDMSCSLQSTE